MDRDAAEILERAIRLPNKARAALADSLLGSLDTEVDEGSEDAWREEIERRIREIDSSAVPMISWSEVRRNMT
jgi:putative addiction module component (TIGR02574 family)